MAEDPHEWQAELARHDRDRFACAMLAPPQKREALLALLAWNYELARVADMVREEMVGFIRQAWWREALEEIRAGKPPRPHAVVQAMAEVLEDYDLPMEPFERIVSARGDDLAKTPFATLEQLEHYSAETAGSLQQLWAQLLDTDEEPAKHAGTAWGLIGSIRATHVLAHQNKLRLPTDMLNEAGIKQDDVLTGQYSSELAGVVKQVADLAELHLQQANKQPLTVLAKDYLKRIRKSGHNPFDPRIEQGRGMRALKLWWGGSSAFQQVADNERAGFFFKG